MVIGNGMIAKEFKSYEANEEFIIFASGVSDSTHASASDFKREETLLTQTIRENKNKILVYFSTCSIYDPSMQQSAYVKHKKNMESLIIKLQPEFTIFRLSNPVGKTNNKHTVVNFFISNILEKHPFEAWQNASRNIIDIDDMYILCNEILQKGLFKQSTVNIANPHNYPVKFIIENIESHFSKKGQYNFVEKGDSPHIDTTPVKSLFIKFNINFDQSYLSRLLQKYFPL